ncbi:MAG: 50S ribosomal protein L2 [Candidatus Nealsonbacteria bacterium CG_4_10_14_0_2_um_filter_39_15]|uniref:Large ribosomal subunit protein uL2 n=1 Tax=Candidatus Nealsonbacteria bacterium CG_4_10_14_0_2_um_filter_39_15 TaxID=1974681 RepID=A0A2M7UWV6_9BACT|nr:MAG: 50S ribosomal protein L2 [Candidatus Nealsonbacteria bacterium CG_4_10_14_0_2_um_filter_39_15]
MAKIQKSKSILTKKEPERRWLLALKSKAGRTASGRITVRHRGGGVKRLYRVADFGQDKLGVVGKVIALEYDPYRTAYLVLVEYQDGDRRDKSLLPPHSTTVGLGEKRYILAPYQLNVGDEIICNEAAEIKIGNRMKLKNIPVGTQVYNIELEPGKGGKMARSAGSTAKVLAREAGLTHLAMPSGEIRKVPQECFASIGQVSRPEHRFITIGKAGRVRLKGRRPQVRGTAMNPCDHPHGGGEGKTPIGLKYPKTPWGKPALGVKTRKKKWTDKYIVKRRN